MHEQMLKLRTLAVECVISRLVVFLRGLSLLGRNEAGPMEVGGGGGFVQLWALPAHFAPLEKEPLMAPAQGQRFERRSWAGSRGASDCLYAASRQQLKNLSIRISSILPLYTVKPPILSSSQFVFIFAFFTQFRAPPPALALLRPLHTAT